MGISSWDRGKSKSGILIIDESNLIFRYTLGDNVFREQNGGKDGNGRRINE